METSSRPSKYHALNTAITEFYLKEIKEQFDVGTYHEENIKSLIDQFDEDAFKYGKNLDTWDGWEVDFELCEALDGARSYVNKTLTVLVKNWAKENPVEFYTVGTKVSNKNKWSPIKEGVISTIHNETNQYAVSPVDKPDRFYILNHEDVEVIS